MDEPRGFWRKAKRLAGKVPFVDHAVALYFCMLDPMTPFWAKAQIAGSLAYFASPIDAVPDFIPVAGLSDDAAVITTTVALVSIHVTSDHVARARDWLEQ